VENISKSEFIPFILRGCRLSFADACRTFGLIWPSLPKDDYDHFSRDICEAILVNRCEHIWAEALNVRGKSFKRTLAGLHTAGFEDNAMALSKVMVPGKKSAWEDYARATFEAHTRNIPRGKLRFLQYVTDDTKAWWSERED
jgi:hypothetical protein